jgi:hypothetical protein
MAGNRVYSSRCSTVRGDQFERNTLSHKTCDLISNTGLVSPIET